MQENWTFVCRTYVLEDNFTFYFWIEICAENYMIRTCLLYVMVWLVLYAQKKYSTTYVLTYCQNTASAELRTVHFRKDLLCQTFMQYLQQKVCFSGQILKVRQFQNEFVKSSFLPKYEQIIVRISALCSEGRNFDNLLFAFWEKWWLHKFFLKLSDL